MRRQGVNVAVCYVDPAGFTGAGNEPLTGTTGQITADYLAQHDVPVYLVRRGDDINRALSRPLAPRTEAAELAGEKADLRAASSVV